MFKRFTCCKCKSVVLATGGQSGFKCQSCRGDDYTTTDQYKAHLAVAKAIKKSELAHPSHFQCTDCASPATEYDHRDYSKPLDVQAVCRGCNARRGPAIGHQVKRLPISLRTPTFKTANQVKGAV